MLEWLLQLVRNPGPVIEHGGYPVLIAIVFAETGLLIGFFLPGDSLLVTAGALVAADLINPLGLSPFMNLLFMNLVLICTAVAGDAVGFSFGARTGPALFRREQSFFFRKDRLLAAQGYYDKHGGKTIIIARFVPFLRTFAPIVAGIGKMNYRRFLQFNVVGGVGWVSSMTFLGYFLGKLVGAKTIEKVIYLVIVISVSPILIGLLKSKLAARKAAAAAPAIEKAD